MTSRTICFPLLGTLSAVSCSVSAEATEPCHWDPPQVCIVGAILMFFIWGVRRLWSFIAKNPVPENVRKKLPLICLGIGVIFDVAVGIVDGAHWHDLIMFGLLSGASAIAMWEAVFKYLPW